MEEELPRRREGYVGFDSRIVQREVDVGRLEGTTGRAWVGQDLLRERVVKCGRGMGGVHWVGIDGGEV